MTTKKGLFFNTSPSCLWFPTERWCIRWKMKKGQILRVIWSTRSDCLLIAWYCRIYIIAVKKFIYWQKIAIHCPPLLSLKGDAAQRRYKGWMLRVICSAVSIEVSSIGPKSNAVQLIFFLHRRFLALLLLLWTQFNVIGLLKMWIIHSHQIDTIWL